MISWLQVLILGLIPMGQLWARIFNFNGSLDKWWLMFPLLLIPPFSFIPMLLMKFGFVGYGKGTKPLDYWIWLPILVKLIIPFLMPYMIDEESEKLTSLISIMFILLATMLSNLIRRYKNCESITINSTGKAFIDSTIAFSMGKITAILVPWIPVIGTGIKILQGIFGGFISSILWIFGFSATYILINMFNQDNMTSFCSAPFSGKTSDKFPFIISVITLILSIFFG